MYIHFTYSLLPPPSFHFTIHTISVCQYGQICNQSIWRNYAANISWTNYFVQLCIVFYLALIMEPSSKLIRISGRYGLSTKVCKKINNMYVEW